MYLQKQNYRQFIGKKNEVSLRLFDVFKKNMGFIFFQKDTEFNQSIGPLNESDWVSKFDGSHVALSRMFYNQYFLNDDFFIFFFLQKILIDFFFH